jgi:hypothetical protein
LDQDDRMDALAIAVGYWVQAMARDVDKAMGDEKERRLDAELKRFMDHVLGGKPIEQIWMDL